jgi:hypothetical protein
VRDIVVISCSFNKRTDGEDYYTQDGPLREVTARETLGQLVLRTRTRLLYLIQAGQIDGTEYREGNRAARVQNKALSLGPDFGGKINERKYLPAYLRYTGRTYQARPEEWANMLTRPATQRPSILIMSGLYGLLPFDEQIQNYDCHITDTDLDSGQIVRDHWSTLMTDILLAHAEWMQENGFRVGRIFDLLSESSYQDAIRWDRVYPKFPVLHRVFEKRAGRDALENMGVWLRKIIIDPIRLTSIVPDTFYADNDFSHGDKIAFEQQRGVIRLPVTRD